MTKDEALWKVWKTACCAVFQGAVGAFCASTAPSSSTGRPRSGTHDVPRV